MYSITESAPFSKVISSTLCIGPHQLHDSDDIGLLVRGYAAQSGSQQLACARTQGSDSKLTNISSKHVLRFMLGVNEVPMTANGKKVETLVKSGICSGEINAQSYYWHGRKPRMFHWNFFWAVLPSGGEEQPYRGNLLDLPSW